MVHRLTFIVCDGHEENMKRIGVIAKQNKPEVGHIARHLVEWLRPRRAEVYVEEDLGKLLNLPLTSPYLNVVEREEMPGKVELIVILGGDGTLLSMARLVWNHDIP